jgi:hypothetical protein
VNPGPVQGFVGIDVADSGQEVLVQQEGFDQTFFGLNSADKFPARNLQGLGAQPAQRSKLSPRPHFFEPNSPKLPGVVEAQLVRVIPKGKKGVGMRAGRCPSLNEVQLPRHPQVHD